MTTATQTMNVVALFRVSTEKQATEGASLDAQERNYRVLAQRAGWQTVAEFRGCESATQAASDRRVLQQVLACVREHRPDAVYVHEQSRLTRGDELEVAILMRELKENRVKIIVNGVVRDLDSIDERFMVGIQSLVDRAEAERIKERLGRGKKERARQGKKASGPAPFGYRNPHPGEVGRGTLQIVPDEAVTVRRIFGLAASGKGEQAIAKALNAMGAVSPRGGKWGKSSVRRVLQNPAYIGTAATNVWVTKNGERSFRLNLSNPAAIMIENAHKPIIERDVWDAVHGRAKATRSAVPRMLTGLLWVGGQPFAGDANGELTYYRGPRGVRGLPWLLEKDVDDAVWDAFASLATSEEFVERLMTEAAKPGERLVLDQEIAYLEEAIGKKQKRLARLVDMRADGDISREVFQQKTDEEQRAIAAHKTELATLRAKSASQDGSHAARVVRAVQTVLAGRTRLTRAERREVLRSVVRRVDLEATPTGAVLGRDAKGRVQVGSAARWKPGKVTLHVSVGEESRSGQLGTTSCDCAQVAGTDGNHRSGQLGTTCSCSAPPAPARR